MTKPKLLVTGGTGYVGSFTVRALQDKYEILIVDNLLYGHEDAVPNIKVVKLDLSNGPRLKELMAEYKPEAVVHFAAYIQAGESVTNPTKYFVNNVSGSLNLLNAMVEAGVKKMVFSSSAAVYGNPENLPIKENQTKNPINPYGDSKLMIEMMLKRYHMAYGLNYVALRYFNACGAELDGSFGEDHRPETHIIPLLIRAYLKGEEFIIFGNDYKTKDGTCVRDYVHVLDLADVHKAALTALFDGLTTAEFNCGSGVGFSNLEIVKSLEAVTGQPAVYKFGSRRPGDPDKLVAGVDKIKDQLGWQAKYSDIKTITSSAFKWHKNHPLGYNK